MNNHIMITECPIGMEREFHKLSLHAKNKQTNKQTNKTKTKTNKQF